MSQIRSHVMIDSLVEELRKYQSGRDNVKARIRGKCFCGLNITKKKSK